MNKRELNRFNGDIEHLLLDLESIIARLNKAKINIKKAQILEELCEEVSNYKFASYLLMKAKDLVNDNPTR